ncbi:acetyltransferase [Vibrio profundum]|uniref:acetyltransferase n=1 Tax=Vibrio profundum TaxID=2910247 RepID=UPI003D0E1E76
MSNKSRLPIVMIGGGGHASVLVDILLQQGREILAVVSPDDVNQRPIFSGITHLRNDDDVFGYLKEDIRLVNGIGMMPKSSLRRRMNEHFLSLGYKFETIIADSAFVSPFSEIGHGAQVLPMSIIQTGATIGNHSIVNTGAIIEHDCQIGEYNHIAPNATLCGQVITDENAYVGAGATIIQGLSIGRKAVVGAGANLTKSLSANTIAYPARVVTKIYV